MWPGPANMSRQLDMYGTSVWRERQDVSVNSEHVPGLVDDQRGEPEAPRLGRACHLVVDGTH